MGREVWSGLARAVLATVVVLSAYFLFPLDRLQDVSPYITLTAALAGFATLIVFQVRAIMRARHPGLRAVEALGTSVPLFLVIFAATYYTMSVEQLSWFSEHLSRLDALYFTLTIFATVGFGDITAKAPPARIAVTVQMAMDLLVVGVALRIILGAVRVARERRGQQALPNLQ